MRLKALEISGFKSFADKTVLNFTSNVTGIVGPNGCGKSNVVDALRWAMGEQSARYLRGQTMEDVIFNGSERLAPIGMAEVTALLDNSDHSAPGDYRGFSEIAVTRRLFRSGESEYSINRVPCRLRDIVELFLGTGVGNKSYSIIGQGRVEELVNAKPEDRRRIIEEAAGTSRFKHRRQAAERKMDQTRQNLLRANDILREVEQQLHKIELQAKRAERYRSLQGELEEKDLRWAAVQRQVFEREIAERGAEMRAVDDRITSLTATASSKEAENERSRGELLELDGQIGESQERLYQLRLEVSAKEQRIEFLEREESDVRESIERVKGEALDSAARLEAVLTEISELNKASEEFSQLALSEAERVDRGDGEVADLRTRIAELQGEVEGERDLLVNRLGEHSQLINARRLDEEHLVRLNGEATGKESDRIAVGQELEALDEQRTQGSVGLEQCRVRVSEMGKRLSRADLHLDGARSERAEHEEALTRHKESLQEARSLLGSLETLQRNFEGYQEGARAIMLKHQGSSTSDGVCGVVADFIEAPEEVEKALTAALGDRLQYVIVEGHEEGVAAIEYLKQESAGRCGFIPRRFRHSNGAVPPLSSPDVVAPLSGLVEVKDGYREVADYLLADVAVVRDLQTGLDLWRSNGFSHSLVTLDGEVIDPMGVVSGGSAGSLEGSPISRHRKVKELKQQVVVGEEAVRCQAERVVESRDALQRMEAEREHMTEEIREVAVTEVRLEQELLRMDRDTARLRQDLATIDQELSSTSREVVGLHEAIATKDVAITGSVREKVALETRLQELKDYCRQSEQELQTADAHLTESRVKAAEAKERAENSRSNLENRVSLRDGLASQLSERKTRVKAMNDRALEMKTSGDECRLQVGTLKTRLNKVEGEVTTRQVAYQELSTRVRQVDEVIHLIRPDIDAGKQDQARLQLSQSEKSMELRHLSDDVRERYGADLMDVPLATDEEAASARDLQVEATELRSRLQRMGEVNLAAIGEFEELTERSRFLSEQRDDLERSLGLLQQTITKLNRICLLRFRQSFEDINREFQNIFPRLFDGGRASLTLTDENDHLETGVDIVAQPPGKKLQSISLLSGGEKALTAVSLLFAIFMTKPSPFCFLDEVDAPLDDVNLERFIDVVEEMTRLSQFMIITHNKRTMLAADILYGVTMENPGVSKLVSVEMV